MKRLLLGLATIGLTAVATGCAKDPTGSLSGTASSISTSLSVVNVTFGDSVLVIAELRDAQGVPLADVPEVASATPAIVEVVAADEPPLSIRRFYVKGVGAGAGEVTVSFGSVSKTVTVIVFPTSFDGTLAVSSAGRLDVVTVTASPAIGFDSAASEVFIGGEATRILSATSTELQAQVLSKAGMTGAAVTITNLLFLPGSENEASVPELDADGTVDVGGEPDEPANDDINTATALALGTTVTGSVGSGDASDYYEITVASAGTLNITLLFGGGGADPDIDGLLYDGAQANVANAFTLNNPETISFAVTAGTYYFEINLFDSGGASVPHWYDVTATVN